MLHHKVSAEKFAWATRCWGDSAVGQMPVSGYLIPLRPPVQDMCGPGVILQGKSSIIGRLTMAAVLNPVQCREAELLLFTVQLRVYLNNWNLFLSRWALDIFASFNFLFLSKHGWKLAWLLDPHYQNLVYILPLLLSLCSRRGLLVWKIALLHIEIGQSVLLLAPFFFLFR